MNPRHRIKFRPAGLAIAVAVGVALAVSRQVPSGVTIAVTLGLVMALSYRRSDSF